MIHRSLPRFQHGQKVAIVVLHVFAAHEAKHFVITQVADDDVDLLQARSAGGFDAVVSEGNLDAVTGLPSDHAFP